MAFGIYPDLTKDYILERISQEQIMEKYLGIPIKLETLVTSPLRLDNNPTCSFYYTNYGKLKFRDFSGHFWGDCFDVAAYRLRLNSQDKKAFKLILHTIAKDFRIHKYEDITEVNNYDRITESFHKKVKANTEPTRFKIVFRAFNYHDESYWKPYNVSEKLLKYGRVYFAQIIEVSKYNLPYTNIYNYKPNDPAYCYYGGKDHRGIDIWKIYLPFRKRRGEVGFYSNGSFLQGKHMITCDRVGVITSSFKDVLTLRSIAIQSVAPTAEGVLITPDEYWFLRTKFDFLVSCMDYDRVGMRMAKKLRELYNIQPIMFTNGLYGSHNFKAKDPSDYMALHNPGHFKNVIQNLFNHYKGDIRAIEKHTYHSLKFIK